jgi:hypothetical protein
MMRRPGPPLPHGPRAQNFLCASASSRAPCPKFFLHTNTHAARTRTGARVRSLQRAVPDLDQARCRYRRAVPSQWIEDLGIHDAASGAAAARASREQKGHTTR